MPPSRELLAALSAETRFQPDSLEKVLRLIEVLREIDRHPHLGPRLALKGGTALNLFHADLRRISVDIDFNYIGELDRERMLQDRPQVEQAVESVALSLGYPLQQAGLEEAHAGTRWVLSYTEVGGSTDHLEVSINWLHRVPLLQTERRQAHRIHPAFETGAALVASQELYAGKVAALLDRAHPRDLFDMTILLSLQDRFDERHLRPVSLYYLATGRHDPREVGLTNVLRISEGEVRRFLHPLLRRGEHPSKDNLVGTVLPHLEALLDLSENEKAFFDAICRGELRADLIFEDADIRQRAERAPPMHWKLLNVRENLAGRKPPQGRRRGRPRRHA